jgi:hypothetical protein
VIGWLFAASGAAAGAAHAALLARTVRAHPLFLLLRLGLVGAFLVVTARAGHLAVGFAGWIAGFALAGVAVLWRHR